MARRPPPVTPRPGSTAAGTSSSSSARRTPGRRGSPPTVEPRDVDQGGLEIVVAGGMEPIVEGPGRGHPRAEDAGGASAGGEVVDDVIDEVADGLVDGLEVLDPIALGAAADDAGMAGAYEEDGAEDAEDGGLDGLVLPGTVRRGAAADDEGPVLDMGSGPLVRRRTVPLPEGEWVRSEGDEALAADDTVPSSRGDDLYTAFVREATRLQRLSEDEERLLGIKVRDHQDQAAARLLVVHNLRLAIKMAHQYKRSWTNLMDLVQEASAGMAIAAQRWDPDQGTRFGTYAVFWIRAQLTKFLMTNGRAIHTGNTRAGRKLYFQLPRVRRKLLAEGREPSIAAIAAEVQEDPAEVARIVARLDGREASLDAPVGPDDESATLGDVLANADASPEQNAAQREVQGMITHLMERFAHTLESERDRAIWTEHLIAPEPRSLVELGARYGVSKQRMGQLATRIKRAFRRHIIDELGPSTQLHWLFAQD